MFQQRQREPGRAGQSERILKLKKKNQHLNQNLSIFCQRAAINQQMLALSLDHSGLAVSVCSEGMWLFDVGNTSNQWHVADTRSHSSHELCCMFSCSCQVQPQRERTHHSHSGLFHFWISKELFEELMPPFIPALS